MKPMYCNYCKTVASYSCDATLLTDASLPLHLKMLLFLGKNKLKKNKKIHAMNINVGFSLVKCKNKKDSAILKLYEIEMPMFFKM